MKVLFSITNDLSRYLQGKDVDIMAAKWTCYSTIAILEKIIPKDAFNLIWTQVKDENQYMIEVFQDKTNIDIYVSKQMKTPSTSL